jgi:hypothetical protein
MSLKVQRRILPPSNSPSGERKNAELLEPKRGTP